MPKVGEGWVEVTTRVDDASLQRARERIEQGLDGIEAEVDLSISQAEIESLQRTLEEEFDNITAEVNFNMSELIAEIREIRELLERELSNIRSTVDTEISASDLAATRAAITAALRDITVNIDVDDGRLGRTFRRAGAQASQHFIIEFLRAVANAFQLNSAVGGAIILGLIALAVAIAVPLGAMLGGLIAAALGSTPLIAAAIIGAIDNEDVANAADRLGDRLKAVVDPIKEALGDELIDQIEKVERALDRWEPHIQNLLLAGARFLDPIVDALISATNVVLPKFDELINSPFMSNIMQIVANGLVQIADAFVTGWDDILQNPQAQAGFERGLRDLFGLVTIIIRESFNFLSFLAEKWEEFNTENEDGETTLDRVKGIFEGVKTIVSDIIALVNDLNSELGELETGDGFWGDIQEFLEIGGGVTGMLSGRVDAGQWFKDQLQDIVDEFNMMVQKHPWMSLFFGLAGGFAAQEGILSDQTIQAITDYWDEIKYNWDVFWAQMGQRGEQGLKRIKGDVATVMTEVGELFASAYIGITTGDWSRFASWFEENVVNRLPMPFQVALQAIKRIFDKVVQQIKSGEWFGLPRWFDENVIQPLKRAWDRFWGGLAGVIQAASGGVVGAIISLVNLVIDAINRAIASYNSIPFASNVPGITPIMQGRAAGSGGGGSRVSPRTVDRGFHEGGPVGGPPSMRDTIPAMLSSGEYVINARAAFNNRPLLDAINSGRSLVPNVNVFVDGVKVAHRQQIESSNNRLAQNLRARAHI